MAVGTATGATGIATALGMTIPTVAVTLVVVDAAGQPPHARIMYTLFCCSDIARCDTPRAAFLPNMQTWGHLIVDPKSFLLVSSTFLLVSSSSYSVSSNYIWVSRSIKEYEGV